MRPNLVAGLDIGSTKTCAIIAEVAGDPPKNPLVKILGVGQARSSGVRREVVTDIEGTTEGVRQAMKEAELMAGVTVDRVYAGIAGEHIEARVSTGVVAIGGDEVTAADVRRVQEVARAVVVPQERELLHVFPQEYVLDEQRGIRDPVGMAGTRLEAEVYMITSAGTAGQNLRRAVQRAGYRIEALVHEPFASALAVLTEDEKDVGVALVELGAATTELVIFRDGKLRHLASIPWGGHAITNDLVKGLSVPYGEAERAKETHGVAIAQLVDPRETIELPGPGPDSVRQVSRELLAHIIEQRLDEILGMVAAEVDGAGETGKLGAGVVLTGGGASMPGATEVTQRVFGMPARVGTPGAGLTGLSDSVRKPKFATAVGLVMYAASRTLTGGSGTGTGFGESAMGRLVTWLKEFF